MFTEETCYVTLFSLIVPEDLGMEFSKTSKVTIIPFIIGPFLEVDETPSLTDTSLFLLRLPTLESISLSLGHNNVCRFQYIVYILISIENRRSGH